MAARTTPRDGRPHRAVDLATAPPVPDPAYVKNHRQRLRERFLAGDPEALPDYELLELLLFHTVERVDVKPLAKQMLGEFGDLGAVLAAPAERLMRYPRVTERTVAHFKAVREAARRLVRGAVTEGSVIDSWDALLDYCRASLAHEPTERFRVLFLNRRNRLIADEVQQRGTVDHTPVYPREVVKRALALEASALILVHNHPSGDPTPSQADIEMTREVREAAAALGIVLHDHVVVSTRGATSFRALGLL